MGGTEKSTTHLIDGKISVYAPHVCHLTPTNAPLSRMAGIQPNISNYMFSLCQNEDQKQNEAYILNSRLFLLNSNANDAEVYPNLIYMSDLVASIEAFIRHSPISNLFVQFGSSDSCATFRLLQRKLT